MKAYVYSLNVMMPHHAFRLLLPFFICLLLPSIRLTAAESQDQNEIDFSRQILPILSDKCFVCHGPDAQEEDSLRLDSMEAATADRGGYQAINPKHPDESELLTRIHSSDDPMPPEDAEKRLTEEERSLLTRWIKQGGQYAKHWAFVPPTKQLPEAQQNDDGSTIIDAYISQQLAPINIDLAPEADRATLARRASLVLTGLPPTPDALEAYLNDSSDSAYETFVDHLLEKPSYGEHQARYWLDAVRYGDTHGLHLDNRRGIFPYRDWVVRSLNENLPLDEFITWQLAGDLLPNATLAQKLATGFVRMNPSTSEGGALPEEFQAKNNFDRTETVGTVLLGMTLTCARCHTHKYDPITQTEYYQLFAFFNNTAESSMDGNAYIYGPTVKAPKDQTAWQQWHQLNKQRDELLANFETTSKTDRSTEETQKWENATPTQRLQSITAEDGPRSDHPLRAQATELAKAIAAAESEFTTSLVAQDLPEGRATKLLKRGEYNLATGDPLVPDVPAIMGALPKDASRNRLGFAQWLTSRDHPLVARVLINRIWQRTFGDGLVRSPEDFGLQGQQPTHPELLDWLAVELQDSGWDLKHMLRLMVNSRTFRQQSNWRTDLDDPENRMFARGPSYRLDAEVLRDLALWASQLLDPHRGGEGVKPYQPGGMWLAMAHPASNTKKYQRDKGQRLYRRSLYVYWKRTSPHPMMTLFDAPDRESSCVRRSRTSTSLQSLGLLNETQRIEMGRKLAERLMKEADDDDSRINLLFLLLASRSPDSTEQTACQNLLGQMRKRYQDSEADALELLTIGDANRDESLKPAELAAWTQLAVTVLASDAAILLY
ncbi:MAG: PSD1 and planctomycete cytochrome C domain-containing protein [Pirellulaceae bacterium]|nr:PSD1 and planctomycete cytochrome C domain-containing protein [Pirellulaceae bacterium]